MEKTSKKDVRKVVADLIENSLHSLKLSTPSDKTQKSLVKLSKRFSTLLHDEIKKEEKKNKKALKKIDEIRLVSKVKSKLKKKE